MVSKKGLSLKLLVVCLLVFLLAACGKDNNSGNSSPSGSAPSSAPASSSAAASEAPKAVVDVKTIYQPFIGGFNVYVLKDKGFDLENGVNLKIDAIDVASPLMSLITGDTDVAFMTLQAYMVGIGTLLEEGYDISELPKIVYLHNASQGGDGIVTDSQYTSVADLKGKTVGAQFGQVTHYMLAKALESVGLTVDDVNMVDMGPGKAGSAYVAGNIDAAVTFEPYLSEGVNAGGKIIIDTTTLTNTILDVVVVRADTAADKPAWVQGVLKSIEDGTQYILSDLEGAADIAADDLMLTKEEVIDMYPTFHLYTLEDNKEGMLDGGWLNGIMQDVLDFYIEIGTIKEPYDVNALVTTDFLW